MTAIGYPLKVSGHLDPKPWGGQRLARFGKRLPPEPIGESLESGPESLVTNGPLAGETLGALAAALPGPLLGTRGAAASGSYRDFPLLVKLIDAQQNLSVQVHPDDRLAPPGKRGKTEAWLILDADPGASIIVGIDGPIDVATIADRLVTVPVTAGDVFFIPAGTIHAIGAGVLLYEVQQASDVTYRLYDWGRVREMHVKEGTAAARPDQRATPVHPLRLDQSREVLVACRHFALERWTLSGPLSFPASAEVFRVATVLDGRLTLAGVAASAGDTLVVPADLPSSSLDGNATLLVAYIPDLDADVRGPLAAAGHPEDAIDRLIPDARTRDR